MPRLRAAIPMPAVMIHRGLLQGGRPGAPSSRERRVLEQQWQWEWQWKGRGKMQESSCERDSKRWSSDRGWLLEAMQRVRQRYAARSTEEKRSISLGLGVAIVNPGIGRLASDRILRVVGVQLLLTSRLHLK